MKEETLSNIRKNYYELLELKKQIESFKCYSFEEFMSERDILTKAIQKEKIDETNNILICIGTYCFIHGEKFYEVNETDTKANYKIYLDLEKHVENALYKISIENVKEFEENHTILNSSENPIRFYNKMKKTFYETAIKENQEKAIKKVLEYNEMHPLE